MSSNWFKGKQKRQNKLIIPAFPNQKVYNIRLEKIKKQFSSQIHTVQTRFKRMTRYLPITNNRRSRMDRFGECYRFGRSQLRSNIIIDILKNEFGEIGYAIDVAYYCGSEECLCLTYDSLRLSSFLPPEKWDKQGAIVLGVVGELLMCCEDIGNSSLKNDIHIGMKNFEEYGEIKFFLRVFFNVMASIGMFLFDPKRFSINTNDDTKIVTESEQKKKKKSPDTPSTESKAEIIISPKQPKKQMVKKKNWVSLSPKVGVSLSPKKDVKKKVKKVKITKVKKNVKKIKSPQMIIPFVLMDEKKGITVLKKKQKKSENSFPAVDMNLRQRKKKFFIGPIMDPMDEKKKTSPLKKKVEKKKTGVSVRKVKIKKRKKKVVKIRDRSKESVENKIIMSNKSKKSSEEERIIECVREFIIERKEKYLPLSLIGGMLNSNGFFVPGGLCRFFLDRKDIFDVRKTATGDVIPTTVGLRKYNVYDVNEQSDVIRDVTVDINRNDSERQYLGRYEIVDRNDEHNYFQNNYVAPLNLPAPSQMVQRVQPVVINNRLLDERFHHVQSGPQSRLIMERNFVPPPPRGLVPVQFVHEIDSNVSRYPEYETREEFVVNENERKRNRFEMENEGFIHINRYDESYEGLKRRKFF